MANRKIAEAGKKTRFSKGSANAKKANAKSVAVRKAQAALRSSDAIIEADRNGTLANLFDKMVDAANTLFEKGKMESFLKYSTGILEMVNGKQINIKAEGEVKRDINIVFRRATPQDAE